MREDPFFVLGSMKQFRCRRCNMDVEVVPQAVHLPTLLKVRKVPKTGKRRRRKPVPRGALTAGMAIKWDTATVIPGGWTVEATTGRWDIHEWDGRWEARFYPRGVEEPKVLGVGPSPLAAILAAERIQ